MAGTMEKEDLLQGGYETKSDGEHALVIAALTAFRSYFTHAYDAKLYHHAPVGRNRFT